MEPKLSHKERRDMIITLMWFTGKTKEYYKKCTDEQIIEEYDRRAKGGSV